MMTSTKPRKPRDESSNSFAMLIVMLPMLLAAFGLGLDFARNLYIKISLNNALEQAVVSGAGVANTSRHGVTIDPNAAMDAVQRVYAIDRTAGPSLDCIGPKTIVPGTNYPQCWKTWKATVVGQQFIQYGVDEQSTNMFLGIVGDSTQNYHLQAQARIKQATQ